MTEPRDPRLITIRRGGTLSDHDHRLIAAWAATCAGHVLHIFEEADREQAGGRECRWQRQQLPVEIRDLVIDDQRLRNHACWFVFDC